MDRSRPIRVRAADLVQEAILKGHLRPGDEIPQLTLARDLGLSQSSIREALHELEHRGFLRKRGRSFAITWLSDDDLSDLYQVRATLEPLACRLAAYNYRPEVGASLEALVERMAKAGAAGDYQAHSLADIEFHQLIWNAQPNRILARHLTLLCLPLFAYDLVERAKSVHLEFDRSLRQHRSIIELLRSRDGERTERAVRRLIERFERQDRMDFRRLQQAEGRPGEER